MVNQGTFRRDLFYRLNGITITVPPLRERTQDIPLLAQHFVRRLAREMNLPPFIVTSETINVLQAHPWPGNVRELESAMRYAALHAVGSVITPDCLPESCQGSNTCSTTPEPSPVPTPASDAPAPPAVATSEIEGPIVRFARQLLAEGSKNLYRETIAAVDQILLDIVIQHANGNLQQAAEILGISRMTLRTKLKGLGGSRLSQAAPVDEPADEAVR
jgi:two-component system nitrogen regulation response regulator GlnG